MASCGTVKLKTIGTRSFQNGFNALMSLLGANAFTFSAPSTSVASNKDIITTERMSVNTMCFLCIHCCRSFSAKNIFFVSEYSKVFRIYAPSIITYMIKVLSVFKLGTVKNHPRKSVSINGFCINQNLSVTLNGFCKLPLPAAVWKFFNSIFNVLNRWFSMPPDNTARLTSKTSMAFVTAFYQSYLLAYWALNLKYSVIMVYSRNQFGPSHSITV